VRFVNSLSHPVARSVKEFSAGVVLRMGVVSGS
jgi:hypothetical protein